MADIALDWSQAEVTADRTELGLRVPLTARPDAHWLAEFEGLRVSRHLQIQGTGWGVESVGEANEILATRLVPGDEAAVRTSLDELAALASARAAQIRAEEEAARQRELDELALAKQQAADMTMRFRSLECTPAPAPTEAETVAPESTFQDRLRVFGSGRQATSA